MHGMQHQPPAQPPLPASRLDLNLLRVFDAVYEDKTLLRAGKRLHLSQSAISHALARLRGALDDELFVRTARGMEPTPRAVAIAAPIREALSSIHSTLGVEPFDPSTSTRRFVIAANDYVTSVLLAKFSTSIAALAPGVDIIVRPSTRLDLAEQLDVGRIDLAIGIFAEIPARFHMTPIWTQEDVLLMRKGHPLSLREVTIEDLSRFPLLTVSLGGQEEGAVGGYIFERGLARQSEMFNRQALEDALSAVSVRPRYRLTVPHALVVAPLLADSDMISIVPGPLAAVLVKQQALFSSALPYEAPTITLRAIWHRRQNYDSAHVWIREQLLSLERR